MRSRLVLIYSVLAALLLASAAQATPPRPTPGPIRVKLAVSPNMDGPLLKGELPVQTEIPMTVSFDFPFGVNLCQIEVLVMPIDGTATIKGAQPSQREANDGKLSPGASRYDFNCAGVSTGQDGRVSIPVAFQALGKKGAALNVEVTLSAPGSSFARVGKGFATIVLGVNGGKLGYASSEKINDDQAVILKNKQGDAKTKIETLFASPSNVAPLDPALVPEAYSDQVDIE